MDQGEAAIWAAGIGVGATLVMALVAVETGRRANKAALDAAREAGRAQVEAALAGVRLQLDGLREDALWQARRDAYAQFLNGVEDVRMALVHLAVAGPRYFEEGMGSGSAVGEGLTHAREQYRDLLLRHSALRLSADDPEVADAERLSRLAGRLIEDFDDYAGAFPAGDPTPSWRRFESGMDELRDGVEEWALNARRRVQERRAVGVPPSRPEHG
ncbi:hypothetical protein OHS70_06445 [Streptomyces sp. NBC_00390]|uniref:hypothetical protein n=1 Tax=Streptomyces sp. NBC_00390 TaxID=2975736 RepID=UPI002E2022FE